MFNVLYYEKNNIKKRENKQTPGSSKYNFYKKILFNSE